MRRYFKAYALNSAGVVEDKAIYDAAGIDRKTALAYEALLANLLIVEALPAWTTNRLKRLVLSPKRRVVDTALAASILRLDVNAILRSGDLLGRLLDTFVVSQLRAEIVVSESRPRLYHIRQQQGRFEVDLLGELGGGQVVGMEVKAGAAPTGSDARHLVGLRDRLGRRILGRDRVPYGPQGVRFGRAGDCTPDLGSVGLVVERKTPPVSLGAPPGWPLRSATTRWSQSARPSATRSAADRPAHSSGLRLARGGPEHGFREHCAAGT